MNPIASFLLELRDLVFGAHQLPSRISGRLKRTLSSVTRGKSPVHVPQVDLSDCGTGRLSTVELGSLASFNEYYKANDALLAQRVLFEKLLVQPQDLFSVGGYCAVCRRDSSFLVDWKYSDHVTPNWRERLICTKCKLPNRVRAMLDFLESVVQVPDSASIYVTEQSTPFFHALTRRYRKVFGSELFSNGRKLGSLNFLRIRNEDLTRLTFDDESFDVVCTADVLEHVPEYDRALRECCRCLRPGGAMVITVPFLEHSQETLVRARLRDDGSIEHLEPPEFHGNPLSQEGSLCYYHFGWDFLDSLTAAGFSEVNLHFYWSYKRGYLGGLQFLIYARKPLKVAAS